MKILNVTGILLIVAAMAVLFQMCSGLDAPTVSVSQIIRVINLDSTQQFAADGLTTIKLRALIPQKATDRNVSFKTSDGFFTEATGNDKTVLQKTARENDGYADALLTVGKIPGTIYVTATIGGYTSDRLLITVDTINIDNLIKLEAVSDITDIKADGKQIIKLKAVIHRSSKERQITFDSSDGFFVDATGNDKTIIQKTAGENDGIAEAFLNVGENPGKLYVTATVAQNKSQTLAIEVKPLKIEDILSFSFDKLDQIEADGESILTITTTVSNSIAKSVKIIASSEAGTFLGSSGTNEREINLDQIGKAQVHLKVGVKEGPHQITANISNDKISFIKAISYNTSFPEDITIDLGASRVDTSPGKFVDISSFLIKNKGLTSLGRQVRFEATQLVEGKEVSVGRFTNNGLSKSDNTGKAVTRFYTDTRDIKIESFVKIKVYVDKKDESRAENSANLYIEK